VGVYSLKERPARYVHVIGSAHHMHHRDDK
jgi:hypothetical protein